MNKTIALVMIAGFAALAAQPAMANELGEKIFKSKCSICHAIDKKKVGFAVKDMNADNAVLKDVVTNGRKAMPKFGSKLSAEEIDAVVAYLAANRDANR
ncbi:MAG TPA: cytochrome c [Mariprofundaceae bacterium]|nr:cytochrome c [Mariprofundaceae bacterium]